MQKPRFILINGFFSSVAASLDVMGQNNSELEAYAELYHL